MKNNKLDIEILEDLIVGRVEPHIYAFTTESIPNYLKVGDTYRPIEQRIKEWKKHFPELKKVYQEVAKVDEQTFFRDFAVHQYLKNELRKSKLSPGDIDSKLYYSNEFFKDTDVSDIADAIADIINAHKQNQPKYKLYNDRLLPKTFQGFIDLNVNVSSLFRILYISTPVSITTLFIKVSTEAVYRFRVSIK